MTGIAGLGWLGEVSTPALPQPLEGLKVGIREDDLQSVVRTSALQVSDDIDATFSIEKARSIGHFMAGHSQKTIVRHE
ncbi:MAG: hypothetical protein AUH75_05395 [Gemmatimonadetes bacterium 13_1_40CM_4_65_7]|nr:MAG: hypothetical protein AUH75_05395 [Gemmatimonadetes bacterium 13_1_40CM_4_65_7]